MPVFFSTRSTLNIALGLDACGVRLLLTYLFAISATIAIFGLVFAQLFAPKTLLLDKPNARSLHTTPKPRQGGIAIAIAVGVLAPFVMAAGLMTILYLALALSAISLLDDQKPLPVLIRLCVHVAAAIAVVVLINASAASVHPLNASPRYWMASLPTICIGSFLVLWMTNLFNFMDGADGLAGGMALIGFGTFAFAASGASNAGPPLAALASVLAGAAAGFLLFNFPPARVFMGDAGSIPLGFLAGALGIYGYVNGLWPWSFAPLVFSPFIVDATVTLAKRAARGEKVWQAHREHYYQRLILSGWSHRKTIFSYYILMLASAISALATQNAQLRYPILSFWVITYASLLLYLEHRIFKNKKATQKATDQAK